jgi:hypothetical protein
MTGYLDIEPAIHVYVAQAFTVTEVTPFYSSFLTHFLNISFESL